MEPDRNLSAEAEALFSEGIGLVLSRWSALQLAVDNEWGGRDSRRKAEQLAADVFSWFTQSAEILYIDDLEEILNDAMLSLNTVTDDGSIEEVAEELMIMNDECLNGKFKAVESLRDANQRRVPVPHVRQVNGDDDDEDEVDDDNHALKNDGSSNMMVDTPEFQSNSNPVDMMDNKPTPKLAAQSEDGWEVVGSRRNRGKRN